MTARATAVVLLTVLGGTAAWSVTAHADPVPHGEPATIYRTVVETRTVDRRIEGWNAAKWRRHAVANRRALNQANLGLRRARQRIIRYRSQARERASSGLTGLVGAFLCIHGGEGGWQSETGNGFHGGLQFDSTFEGQYGGWARKRFGWHAGSWPPEVQLLVAMTAFYSGRGFYPWPNTARTCGLI